MTKLHFALKGSLFTLLLGLVITTACLGVSAVQSAHAGAPVRPVIVILDEGRQPQYSPEKIPASEVHHPVSPLLQVPYESF